jgi:hypothetical protein
MAHYIPLVKTTLSGVEFYEGQYTPGGGEWERVMLRLPEAKNDIHAMLLNDSTVPSFFCYIYVPANNSTLEIYYGDISRGDY